MHTQRSLAILLATGLVACGPAETTAPLPIVPVATDTYTDIEAEPLQDDILWSVRMPGDFNGTLLVHSRGWSPVAGEPGVAPRQHIDSLLAQGYALAASNYGAGGWSVAEAVPAQELVVAEFSKRYTTPNRVIAFGYSMGGLVTTALVEKTDPVVDGGIAFCSSMGGSLGMMNMGLDGAWVFRTLVAPDSGIRVVDITDDRANGALVSEAVARVRDIPAGQARIALAGVFAGIPSWTDPDMPQPARDDAQAQLTQIMGSFPAGVFLPRAEQEGRAGGNFSWNTGIDYTELLNRSGRRDLVEQLYDRAGISLSDDLATLAATPRISADVVAVDYMRANYTPFAQPQVPLLAVQAFGDGITSPTLQRSYADNAPADMMDSQYVARAGHCTFDEAETLASIRRLERRLDTGSWPPAAAPFAPHEPAPMLRACFQGKDCE